MSETQAECPLCGTSVAEKELKVHHQAESEEIRDYVIGLIRKGNPGWVANDGTCLKCWEHYQNL